MGSARPATQDSNGRVLTPASIACTLPEVFDDVCSGERVWLDDGAIGGVVQNIQPDRVIVKIDFAGADGSKLRADKGINLPDSNLRPRRRRTPLPGRGRDAGDRSCAAGSATTARVSPAATRAS